MSRVLSRLSPAPRLGVTLALVALLLLALSAWAQLRPDPVASALRRQVAELPPSERYLADIYQTRAFRPLWSRDGKVLEGEARTLLDWTARAADDGLSPGQYQVPVLRGALDRAAGGRSGDLARFDLAMSLALAQYESDLHRPPGNTGLAVVDRALAPLDPASALASASDAPSLADHLAGARRMHPIYEAFRAARLALAATPANEARRSQLLANMDRARMLPAQAPGRYVLVDAAAARLWLYQGGRPVDSMRVVVGKDSQPTPIMAGLIRYAVFDPYWNMPPDLARDQLAPKVLRGGPEVVARERLELLSDWTPHAQPIRAETVDWRSVRSGRTQLRVRQRPGAGNMMGRVKFMFPNHLGVYLHDTSDHSVFSRPQRRLSAGCVRVEDAARLARWLGLSPPASRAHTDWRVDLSAPVPVYITYFSLPIAPAGEAAYFDPYHRDGPSRT